MTDKERKITEQRIIIFKQRIKWNQEELAELEKKVEEDKKELVAVPVDPLLRSDPTLRAPDSLSTNSGKI